MDVDAILQELGARFSDIRPFGEGRTGTLYLARDGEQGRSGVLKLLHPDIAQGSEGMRLKRELARQLKMDHPNLALPSATGEAGDRLWLFRDHVQGETLRVRLEREGTLPVTEALAIVAQVASALDELHRGGMLHRDLKPEHVILSGGEDEVPRAVLIDASIAAPVEDAPVIDLRGTPAYVSPEQAKGKLVSFRSDLYSLGCILHELIAGAPPFRGDDPRSVLEAQAGEPPPDPPENLPDGGKLLASLLAKEPRQRPFSAQQVRRQLEPFLPEDLRRKRPARGAASAPPPGPAHAQAAGTRKQTLLGVPPVSKETTRASRGSNEAASDEWTDEATEQIDAADLVDVAPAPSSSPKASIPPPVPAAV
ncbi:MAG: serine/threonine-protein kinase, partial [Myxococcota bacterium]